MSGSDGTINAVFPRFDAGAGEERKKSVAGERGKGDDDNKEALKKSAWGKWGGRIGGMK